MEVFPLRPSAYLCVLCVNGPFNAESRRDTQRPQRYAEAAEKTNQICHFLCKASLRRAFPNGTYIIPEARYPAQFRDIKRNPGA